MPRRFLTSAAALPLAAVLALTSSCGSAEAAGGTGSSGPSSGFSWQDQESELCHSACHGAPGWLDRARVADERLSEAIFVLSEYMPELSEVLDYNLKSGTRLVVASPGNPGAAADYDPATRVIRVSPKVIDRSIAILASIVAHELVHGAQDHSQRELDCQREIEAYAWTGVTWERLKALTHDRSAGYDEVAAAWHAGTLPALVASWSMYGDVCGVAK